LESCWSQNYAKMHKKVKNMQHAHSHGSCWITIWSSSSIDHQLCHVGA
jgi:hypothetical protein